MLKAATISLLAESPFLGNLILEMRVRIDEKKVPTAGVNITDKINLYINPNFWNSLSHKEQVAILKHECFHILLSHPSRGKDKMHTLFNIACDLAINEFIKDLPRDEEKKALLVQDMKKDYPTMERFMNAEYYYDLLKDANQDLIDKLADMIIDDHGIWEEGEANPTVASALIQDLVRKAKNAKNVTPGDMPRDLQRIIDDVLKPSGLNWKNQLNYFINRTVRDLKESTRKRLNRRYGLKAKGRKKSDVLRLHIGLDVSGSVDEEAISRFFNEINKIYTITKDINIMECDAEINTTYPYTGKPPKNCTGGGGTMYQPMLEKAKKDGADALIIFGDMQHFDSIVDVKIPILFVNYTEYEYVPAFGKHIRM